MPRSFFTPHGFEIDDDGASQDGGYTLCHAANSEGGIVRQRRTKPSSVWWYGLVHEGVGVEASFQVQDLIEAGPLERPGNVGAADAVVADHHGLGAGIELGKAFPQL